MIKPKEIPSTPNIENDSHYNAVPRRHTERRQTTNLDAIKSENSAEKLNNSSKDIVERRVEDRRKSRPTAFLSAEELVKLRKC